MTSIVRLIQIANRHGLVVIISPSSSGMALAVRDIGEVDHTKITKMVTHVSEDLIKDPGALEVFIYNSISSLILTLENKQ